MRNIINKITLVWAASGGLILLVIVAVTMINVTAFSLNRVARLFDGNVSGLPGYEDAVTLLAGVAALSFFPWCQLHREHISVDLFSSMFSSGVQKFLDVFSDLLMTAIAFLLGYSMLSGALEIHADGALSPVLGWPIWPFYISGVLSCFLWGVVALYGFFTGIGLMPAPATSSDGDSNHGT